MFINALLLQILRFRYFCPVTGGFIQKFCQTAYPPVTQSIRLLFAIQHQITITNNDKNRNNQVGNH